MIRADVHMPYFRKHLWIAGGGVCYALWCLYDGLVAYPQKLKIAQAFEAIPDDLMRETAWIRIATEQGWSTKTPVKTAEEVAGMIGGQFVYAAICASVAIIALVLWARARGTWVEGDESTIRSSWGAEVAIPTITKINKRKWADKGIARVHFDVDGRVGRFVMDDFKYDANAMAKILTFAEAHLGDDDVVGDKLERVKVAEAEAAKAAADAEDANDAKDDAADDLAESQNGSQSL